MKTELRTLFTSQKDELKVSELREGDSPKKLELALKYKCMDFDL